MIEYLVKKWRKKFKLPVNTRNSLSKNLDEYTDADRKLDFDIIREELSELESALLNKDLPEILDGVGDLQFVLWQLYSKLGLTQEIINDVTEVVYNSNMTKACYTREAAEETVDFYTTEKGVSCTIDDEDENFILVFKNNGKLLKNKQKDGFKEPDFKNIMSLWS
jgi:hypothetical protein